MTASEGLDPGAQPERTQLAWRRTALSIGVGSLIAVRVFPEMLGSAWAMLPGFAGIVFAAWLWAEGRRRYHAFGRDVARGRVSGAGALLAVVVFTVAFGALAMVLVIVQPV